MAKKKPAKRPAKAKAKPSRAKPKSTSVKKKPATAAATPKAVKWYAYCTVKAPPHGSNMGAYFDWAGERRATRAEALADAKNHNKNAGHKAQVLSA